MRSQWDILQVDSIGEKTLLLWFTHSQLIAAVHQPLEWQEILYKTSVGPDDNLVVRSRGKIELKDEVKVSVGFRVASTKALSIFHEGARNTE